MDILVAQSAFLGDAVLTTPLLRALKRALPDACLTLVCTPPAKELLAGLPFIDSFILDFKREEGSIRSVPGLLKELRRTRWSAAVAAHRSARTALLLAASGAKRRIGFAGAPLAFLYHDRVRDVRGRVHAARRWLELARPLGLDPDALDARPELPRDACAEESVSMTLQKHGIGGKEKFALFCHGSEWETKKWTEEGYAALARLLHETRGMRVVLCAHASEAARGARIAEAARVPVADLTGRTTLRETAALVARATLVVSNDSAPLHMAAAFERPVVGVFGPTLPSQGFGPVHAAGKTAGVANLYCRPCGRHGARRCPEGHFRCMKDLAAEAVLVRADEAMRA